MIADHRPQRDRDPRNPEAEQKYQEKAARTAGEANTEVAMMVIMITWITL